MMIGQLCIKIQMSCLVAKNIDNGMASIPIKSIWLSSNYVVCL